MNHEGSVIEELQARSRLDSAFIETPAAERFDENEEDDVTAETPLRRNPGRAAKFDGKYPK